jgi:tetratricopeptide (TPR) repeat protein
MKIASLSTASLAGLLGLSFAASPRNAWALSCEEIMNMVNVNVPVPIVVQTIEDSGDQFTVDEIRCLQNEGAPAEVVAAAKGLMAGQEPEQPVDRGETEVTRPRDREPAREPEDDMLGGDRASEDGASGDREPTDQGGPDPEQVAQAIKLFRAKKPLTASLMLYEMLEDNTFPERESQIEYYLARCLYELEMYHSAQYYFLEVLKKGPENPYFKHALPKLVAIANSTGDNSELIRVVAKIPPEAFPRSARNHLFYLMGVRLYEEDDLSRARKYFGQISDRSDQFLRAKYFEGVIYNRQGRLKSAVRSFRDVVQQDVEVDTPRALAEVKDIKNLSLVNVARIYYSIQRFDEASQYYSLVDRDSSYWPTALFESAWSDFMRNDLNLSLGEILTVQSPFFAEDEFVPEATVLRALTYFNLCEYNEVERLLIGFEEQYRPMYNEMKAFVQQYASTEGKKLADQAYDAYFTAYPRESVLPRPVFNKVLRNRDLAALVRHLDQMEREKELIDAQKARWHDSLGNHLKKVLETDRARYKRRAGLLFLSEMAQLTAFMGDLLAQSEIIRFEVVDAQRVDYEYRMNNVDMVDSANTREIDFATSVDKVFWPFNGEFWADELGYYHYTEQGSCK